jgi:hypothetical protein
MEGGNLSARVGLGGLFDDDERRLKITTGKYRIDTHSIPLFGACVSVLAHENGENLVFSFSFALLSFT